MQKNKNEIKQNNKYGFLIHSSKTFQNHILRKYKKYKEKHV